jgi:tetratricopeptide (TPR) repeat protein
MKIQVEATINPMLRHTTLVAARLGASVWATSALGGSLFEWESVPLPFVWRDVAVVHFVCALPLATIFVALAGRRLANRSLALAAMGIGMGGIAALLLVAADAGGTQTSAPPLPMGNLLRSAIAFAAAIGALLALFGFLKCAPQEAALRVPFLTGLCAAAALLIAPLVYVNARVTSDAARLTQLLNDDRWGEAYLVGKGLAFLDPHTKWRSGYSDLAGMRRLMDRQVTDLLAAVNSPLAADATDVWKFGRAYNLAVLGRTAEAIRTLRSAHGWQESVAACNLLGTMYETREQWSPGWQVYQRARTLANAATDSRQTDGLLRAIKGVAYCERKLGNCAAAEAGYLELLKVAPTADNHFLLAQFYDDTQQTAKARSEAQLAMSLDPQRYQQSGQALIDKLMLNHFGCWGVFTAEGASRFGAREKKVPAALDR